MLASNATILVIDDEPIVRQTAKAMLERYGYTVLLAENGKEGVDLFRVVRDKIALVLLDMTMPVMSGDETLRNLNDEANAARSRRRTREKTRRAAERNGDPH